jgi:GNAT superfamily N-acetyltransferase
VWVQHLLPNGVRVVIRPVRPTDKPGLSLGLTRLSAQSVYRRFLSPKPRFTSRELRYLTEVDGHDHVALVAVLAEDPRTIVASGRWVRDTADPTTAEVAVVVADVLQGQGLGSALGRELAAAARRNGVLRFSALMLPENEPALRLFRSISHHLENRVSGGVRELVAVLDEVAVAG